MIETQLNNFSIRNGRVDFFALLYDKILFNYEQN
nr:MAG TPA: hypothetical protein [Caudoviricetes sp.]